MDTDITPTMAMPSHTPSTLVAISTITVNRPWRQRREITPASIRGLMVSIRERGLINPLLVERSGALIAGERRLEACRALGWTSVPVSFRDEVSPRTLQILECEENLHREGLTWQETSSTLGRIHAMYKADSPEWTQAQTAEALGFEPSMVSRYLTLEAELAKAAPHPKVQSASNYREAINVLKRKEAREEDVAREALISMTSDALGETLALQAEPEQGAEPKAAPVPEVLNASVLDFFNSYDGPRFNLLHCDFPYGINAFEGKRMSETTPDEYADTPEVYWALLTSMLLSLDRLMSGAGHMIFWYSNKPEIETKTRHLFATLAPTLKVWQFPLIWLKSDNAGMFADWRHAPRHIYETALFISRGDRLIAKLKADAYAGPTDNKLHPSAKPIPMLKHFFEMLVDGTTSMLDPTCGAGSSLIAADSLGAQRVQGIELDPGFASTAQRALSNARLLRAGSAVMNGL